MIQYVAHILVSKNLLLCSFTTKYTILEMSNVLHNLKLCLSKI